MCVCVCVCGSKELCKVGLPVYLLFKPLILYLLFKPLVLYLLFKTHCTQTFQKFATARWSEALHSSVAESSSSTTRR